jgi:hypothetical protein
MKISRLMKAALVIASMACIAPVASASAYPVWSGVTYQPCTHVLKVNAGLYPAPPSSEHFKLGFEVKRQGQWSSFIGWYELYPRWVSWPNVFTGYASGYGIEVTSADPSRPLVPESVYAWIQGVGASWKGYLAINTLACSSQSTSLAGYNQAADARLAYNITGANLAVSNGSWG